MKQWYELLFENYAHKYDKECFVQGTVGECDFIELEIGRDKSIKIIDIGCGTGRHAIELTKRGYNVTGVDLLMNVNYYSPPTTIIFPHIKPLLFE